MHKTDLKIIAISILPVIVVSFSLIYLQSMLAAFFFYHLVICIFLPALYYHYYPTKGTTLSALLGLRLVKVKESIVSGLITGAIFFATILIFFHYFGSIIISKEHIENLLGKWGYNKEMFVLLAVYFVFFNSIVEEIFWRGFLFSQYRKTYDAFMVTLIISLCFIQYHFITIWLLLSFKTAILFTFMLLCANILWCYLRERNNNIYPAMISHLCADLAIIYVYYQYIYN